jgi:hypothetical protein
MASSSESTYNTQSRTSSKICNIQSQYVGLYNSAEYTRGNIPTCIDIFLNINKIHSLQLTPPYPTPT